MTENSPEGQAVKTSGLRSILTDGVVIALATAFAYFTTFVYEAGYCSNFAIPLSLISPNTSTILVAAAAIGWIFVSSIGLLGFTTPLFRRAKRPNGSSFWAIIGFIAVALIILTNTYEFTGRQIGFILLGILIFLALPIIPAMISVLWTILRRKARKEPGPPPKEISSEQLWFSADEFLENWLPQKIARMFLLFGGVLLVAFMIGDGNAKTQKRYLVLKESPETVVVRIYGDLMITTSFNRKEREISNDISLIWLSEKKQVNFYNEEIGPLKKQAEKAK